MLRLNRPSTPSATSDLLYVVEGKYYGKWLPITKQPVPMSKALHCRFSVNSARLDLKLEPREMRIVPATERAAPCL